MSELALQLIRENIEKHRRREDATLLDLGNCGMTEEKSKQDFHDFKDFMGCAAYLQHKPYEGEIP